MGSIIWNLIIIVTILVEKVDLMSHPKYNYTVEFCYQADDAKCGPSVWTEECNIGKAQSPIDLDSEKSGIVWKKKKINFNGPYTQDVSEFYAKNNGHSFQVQFTSNPNTTSNLTIEGGGLEGQYTFAQLHLHWSQANYEGSEHTVRGHRYPMELHLVHYKSKYGSFENSMVDKDPEALAVLAVLFEIGEHNADMEAIVDAATSTKSLNPEADYENYKLILNLENLIPEQRDFARYLGSLTTPPCTQSVIWTVFMNPIPISVHQLDIIRELPNAKHDKYFNFRPVQNLNGRKVQFFRTFEGPIPSENGFITKGKKFLWKLWKTIGKLTGTFILSLFQFN